MTTRAGWAESELAIRDTQQHILAFGAFWRSE
jgi:hypothetical protein